MTPVLKCWDVMLLQISCWLLETISQCSQWAKSLISCLHHVWNRSRSLAGLQFSFFGYRYKRIGTGAAPRLQLLHLDSVSSTLFVFPSGLMQQASQCELRDTWELISSTCCKCRGSLVASPFADDQKRQAEFNKRDIITAKDEQYVLCVHQNRIVRLPKFPPLIYYG